MHMILEFEKENLGSIQVRDICDKLQKDEVKALSLRECILKDKDYKRILKWIGVSKNLRHLSLNIGIIPDIFRVHVLTQALGKNKSLTGLFIHGNEIGDAGVKILQPTLVKHPRIVSLDIGDCNVGDEGLELICQLLSKRHNHPGLEALVLSSNLDITTKGWAKLAMAISAGCNLRSLYVDYNDLGDSSASCLLVAVAGTKQLQTLDMECVGATETTGQVLLHLVQNYSIAVSDINLDENEISQATMEAIRTYMPGTDEYDISNGIHSDEERSLATSEPPLDPDSDLTDYISPGNLIKIVGATDSPVDTSDGIMTDRSLPTAEETLVVDNDITSAHETLLSAYGNQSRMERDSVNLTPLEMKTETETNFANDVHVSPDSKKHGLVLVNEAQTDTELEPDVLRKSEMQDVIEAEKDSKENFSTNEKGQSRKMLLTKTDISKKTPQKHLENVKTESLAGRIRAKRDKTDNNQPIMVIPRIEKQGEASESVSSVEKEDKKDREPFSVRSTENPLDFQVNATETLNVQKIPLTKFESVEEVEDIEEMDENDIIKAHNSLTVAPSKMSLSSGPGIESASSISEKNNLLQIGPSNSLNMYRRYSHNIEINYKEKENLQGISKHRGSEGNIAERFTGRRGSAPFNARLTVHGVGSTTNLDNLNAGETRRRLSNASTLGDVA